MRTNLKKAYKIANKLFPNVGKICKNCNTCCRTYGWLLKEEAEDFIKKKYPVIELNKDIFCMDSFKKDKNGKRIINRIPKCIFYRDEKCTIHKNRPLDCRLYPIKIKFKDDKGIIGVSLGCKYILSLSEKEKNKLYKRVINFFKEAPKETIKEYVSLMCKVNKLSRPKKFWMKKLIEIKDK